MYTARDPFRLEQTHRGLRCGVTLLELLAVITIMLMITAAAIPMMVTSLQGRQVREAARQVSAYLAGARARAIETGRPVGVYIEGKQPLSNFGNAQRYSMNLHYVEVPPPYSGDVTGAACTVTVVNRPSPTNPGVLSLTFTPTGTFNSSLVRQNDFIKLNYRGNLYQIIDPTTTPVLATYSYGQATAYENNPGVAVPYQIFRQPVKSAGTPLQLPEGAVIDLLASGAPSPNGSDPFLNDPILLFSATGTLAVVYDGPANALKETQVVYLLMGRPEGAARVNPSDTFNPNMLDLNNIWVSVGYQTGEITTAENASLNNPVSGGTPAQSVMFARRFVQSAQGMGGR